MTQTITQTMPLAAIQRRLQKLGRVISAQAIDVRFDEYVDIAQTNGSQVHINPANPPEPDAVRSMICNKGKLYHELGHVMFTKHPKVRAQVCDSLPYHLERTFLAVSNIIEDGRIEHILQTRYPGTRPYFAYVLSYFPAKAGDVFSELLHYVRSRTWLSQDVAEFYAAYTPQIDAAIWSKRTDSKTVWLLAGDMARNLPFPSAPSNTCYAIPQPTPQPEPDAQDADDQDAQTQTQPDAQDTEPQDTDADDQDGDGTAGDDQPDAQDADDQDGAGDTDADDQDGDDQDTDAETQPDATDGDAGDAGDDQDGDDQDAGAQTRARIAAELADDIERDFATIRATEFPAKRAAGSQPLQPSEYPEATRLGSVLTQIATDAKRQAYTPSRRSGSVDSRRITNAVTGGTLLKRRGTVRDKRPAVSVLVDVSGSMNQPISKKRGATGCTRLQAAFSAARVLRAAIQDAKLFCTVLAFGSQVRELKDAAGHVPLRSYGYGDVSTNLAAGLVETVAALALRDEPRKLCIIITDGESKYIPQHAIDALRRFNIFTVGVGIGSNAKRGYATLDAVCDMVIPFSEDMSLATELAELVHRFAQA